MEIYGQTERNGDTFNECDTNVSGSRNKQILITFNIFVVSL